MQEQQKNQIVNLIHTEKERLGSYAKVAKKCGVSEATISLMRNLKWQQLTDDLWVKIANALGFNNGEWVISQKTRDYLYVSSLIESSRNRKLFTLISSEAGTGKTASLETYCQDNAANGAFYLICREWSGKVFLTKMMKMLGMNEPRGYKTADELLDLVIEGILERSLLELVICIDEADKLKPSALRMFIYLFNALHGKCAIVIAGTENLSKEIKQGVKYAKKGYDEIESRFGRSHLPMVGANRKDVVSICESNGLFSQGIIDQIWQEVGTKHKQLNGKRELIVDDLRRLRRIIERETLKKSA
jgi:plasmid maintenance system antidote protein VapI